MHPDPHSHSKGDVKAAEGPLQHQVIAVFTGAILLQGWMAQGSCQERAIKHTLLILLQCAGARRILVLLPQADTPPAHLDTAQSWTEQQVLCLGEAAARF